MVTTSQATFLPHLSREWWVSQTSESAVFWERHTYLESRATVAASRLYHRRSPMASWLPTCSPSAEMLERVTSEQASRAQSSHP